MGVTTVAAAGLAFKFEVTIMVITLAASPLHVWPPTLARVSVRIFPVPDTAPVATQVSTVILATLVDSTTAAPSAPKTSLSMVTVIVSVATNSVAGVTVMVILAGTFAVW